MLWRNSTVAHLHYPNSNEYAIKTFQNWSIFVHWKRSRKKSDGLFRKTDSKYTSGIPRKLMRKTNWKRSRKAIITFGKLSDPPTSTFAIFRIKSAIRFDSNEILVHRTRGPKSDFEIGTLLLRPFMGIGSFCPVAGNLLHCASSRIFRVDFDFCKSVVVESEKFVFFREVWMYMSCSSSLNERWKDIFFLIKFYA